MFYKIKTKKNTADLALFRFGFMSNFYYVEIKM